MLHTKIIDASKKEKIEISKAENFLNQSKFGAVIYFVGTVRDLNENNASEIMLQDQDLDGRFEQKWIDREDNIEDYLLTEAEWWDKWDAIAIDEDQDGTWDKVQDFPKG